MPTNRNETTESVRHDPILVLELYIDLISRVIPGAVLIIGLGYYDVGESRTWLAQRLQTSTGAANIGLGVATLILIVSLIYTYAIGMFLTPIGYLLSCVYYVQAWSDIRAKQTDLYSRWHTKLLGGKTITKVLSGGPFRRFWNWITLLDPPQPPDPAEPTLAPPGSASASKGLWSRLKTVPGLRRQYAVFDMALHEDLKQKDGRAAVILPKMRAEASLCVNLAAALLTVWVGVLFSKGFSSFLSAAPALLSLSIFLVATSGFRFARFLSRTFTFMVMHRHETEPDEARPTT